MNSLPRCFLPAEAWREGVPVLVPDDEARHLARVLRMEPGETVRVFDGAGREADGAIEAVRRDGMTVRLGAVVRHEPAAVRLTLYQALLNSDRMDEVIQRSVELGVASRLIISRCSEAKSSRALRHTRP